MVTTISAAFDRFADLLERQGESESWAPEARQAFLVAAMQAREVANESYEPYEGD